MQSLKSETILGHKIVHKYVDLSSLCDPNFSQIAQKNEQQSYANFPETWDTKKNLTAYNFFQQFV